MNIIVIKLGGSLMQNDVLCYWLKQIQQFSLMHHVVIVPGGGLFADRIREMQHQFNFDESTAHRMALLAMCQYGQMLSGLNPAFRIVEDSDTLLPSFAENIPLIWLPLSLMNDFSDVSANWDFTSDSIALWLAIKLRAIHLLLVKSLKLDTSQDIKQLSKEGKIDKGMIHLIKDFSGKVSWLSRTQYAYLNDPQKWPSVASKTGC